MKLIEGFLEGKLLEKHHVRCHPTIRFPFANEAELGSEEMVAAAAEILFSDMKRRKRKREGKNDKISHPKASLEQSTRSQGLKDHWCLYNGKC